MVNDRETDPVQMTGTLNLDDVRDLVELIDLDALERGRDCLGAVGFEPEFAAVSDALAVLYTLRAVAAGEGKALLALFPTIVGEYRRLPTLKF